jgi:3-methylfumaryl-CoA hydratase
VDHEIHTHRGLAITERQDIVYRGMQPDPASAAAAPPLRAWQWHRAMRANPVTLFRYSAITFNGHRIHYDRPYAIDTEGYSGLVVHGPLQATWLIEFAAAIKGSAPAGFNFRGVRPLHDSTSFQLCARDKGAGLDLWIRNQDGATTMEAKAKW